MTTPLRKRDGRHNHSQHGSLSSRSAAFGTLTKWLRRWPPARCLYSVHVATSTSQVNKAGKTIRQYLANYSSVSQRDLNDALEALVLFRSAHAYPLGKSTMGVRSVVNTNGYPIVVTQRLKMLTTIQNKLLREPGELGRMHDVGGCRAILPTVSAIYEVAQSIEANRRRYADVRRYDYIEQPSESGYRSLHLVVRYPDQENIQRRIEVQLRTPAMNRWANNVESQDRLWPGIRAGTSHPPLVDFFRQLSIVMAIQERSQNVDVESTALLERLSLAVTAYLRREGND